MDSTDKPLVWLHGEVKTPPFSTAARVEAGALLRSLQEGDMLSRPHSRPMPSIGKRCHELRIPDRDRTWRILYRTDTVIVAEVFDKKTRKTPQQAIANAKHRLRLYDEAIS